jgi:hypothetical protein
MSQKMTRRTWLSTLVSGAFGGVLASRTGASSKPMSNRTTRRNLRVGSLSYCFDGLGQRTTITYDGTGQPLTAIRPLVTHTYYCGSSPLRE